MFPQVVRSTPFQEAYNLFESRQYQRSLNVLNQKFDLETSRSPAPVTILAGQNYEALGNFERAKSLYERAIDQAFRDDHRRIVGSFREEGHAFDIGEVPRILSKLYGILVRLYSLYYKQNLGKLSDAEKNQLDEMIYMFSEICFEVDCEGTNISEILDDLDSVKQSHELSQFSWSRNISLSIITWKDSLTLSSESVSQEIESTAKGSCIGGELGYGNYYIRYAGSFCFASTRASVGKDTEQISYFQSDVTVNALVFGPTIYWMPNGGSASIGMELLGVYRSGDYTEPDGFEILESTSLNFGLGLSLNWSTPSWTLFSKLNKVAGFKSSFYQVGIKYNF